jgi:hypothetical protein
MNRSLLLAAVALAAAAAIALPAAAQQTDEAVVPVTGEAVVRGDSLLAANTAAKMNGYREALRMQLSRLLDSLGAVEAFPRLRSRARTYVKAEQIEGEEREGDTLRVAMRLTLDVAKLKQDLEQLGYDIRTIGADHGASVMVVIDEYYVPNPRQVSSTQAPPSAMTGRAPSIPDSAFDPYVRPEFREPGARVSASAIEEALNNNQYIVLDQGSVQQLRADLPGFTGDLVKQGDRLTDFARRANERFHAEIVIVGATTVINGGRDAAGQETRRALMSYRAIDASTGRLLSSGAVESAALAADPLVAQQRASSRVSQIAAERLIPQLTRAARDRASRGELYTVELSGFNSFKQARDFLTAVQGVEGVTNARQTLIDMTGHRQRLEVLFTRPRDELLSELYDAAHELEGFGTFDLRNQRGNEFIFVLRM